MTLSLQSSSRRLSLDPRDPDFVQDPYPAYRSMHEIGVAVFWEQYGFWCFCGHAEVTSLLRDRRFGRKPPSGAGLGLSAFDALERRSLLELDPPEHTRLRTPIQRAFVARQIERLSDKLAATAERLIDGFAPRGEAELIAEYAAPLPVLAIAELIGAPAEDADALRAWSRAMVAMYRLTPSAVERETAERAARDFTDYLRALIGERRARPRDDLASALAHGEIDETDLISTLALLLNAGHEATTHALGLTVRTFLEQRFDASRASAAGLEKAIEEALRFAPPLHLFERYVGEACTIGDIALRAGEKVGLLLAAANRDPRVIADPDHFDPARASNPHVSFGGGAHFCIGAPLARLEARVSIAALFRRAPKLEIVEPPRLLDSFHFHGLEALRVRL